MKFKTISFLGLWGPWHEWALHPSSSLINPSLAISTFYRIYAIEKKNEIYKKSHQYRIKEEEYFAQSTINATSSGTGSKAVIQGM